VTDLARAAGRAVAVPLGAFARWRRGKPMHPRGAVFDGLLERRGTPPGEEPFGAPWLDAVGTDAVVVRMSRGTGIPAPWPDLLGLAVRVPSAGGVVDLLLTTAGSGPLTRRVPVPRRDAAAVYSSIMAYRSDAGALRIAAFPRQDGVPSDPVPLATEVDRADVCFTLAVARGRGAWRSFASLTLTASAEPLDPDIRFDAVRRPPPGLVPDGPMARFREPAYVAAQAARGHGRTRTAASPSSRAAAGSSAEAAARRRR
jgi:hypothetical protein